MHHREWLFDSAEPRACSYRRTMIAPTALMPLSDFVRQRWGVLAAAAILSASFLIGELLQRPVADVWAMLGVEHEGIAFLDLAMITGASDCVSRGLDPYVTATCDP